MRRKATPVMKASAPASCAAPSAAAAAASLDAGVRPAALAASTAEDEAAGGDGAAAAPASLKPKPSARRMSTTDATSIENGRRSARGGRALPPKPLLGRVMPPAAACGVAAAGVGVAPAGAEAASGASAAAAAATLGTSSGRERFVPATAAEAASATPASAGVAGGGGSSTHAVAARDVATSWTCPRLVPPPKMPASSGSAHTTLVSKTVGKAPRSCTAHSATLGGGSQTNLDVVWMKSRSALCPTTGAREAVIASMTRRNWTPARREGR